MTNTREQNPEEQRRQSQREFTPVTVTLQAITETDRRHYAPLHAVLPNESTGYEWRREKGDIQSYQHNQTTGWLHIDPQGQFYDRHAREVSQEHALASAHHPSVLSANQPLQNHSVDKAVDLSQGFGL